MSKKDDAADYYTLHGAGVLAQRIEDYWTKRGYPAIQADRFEILGTSPKKYGVKSNIGPNGFPPAGPIALDAVPARPFVSALV